MHEGGESGAIDDDQHIAMGRLYSDRLCKALGKPRARQDSLTQREKDIARSTQVRFEEAAMHCLNRLHKRVPTQRLAMAGGCALNGVANARAHRETPFTNHYLQAAASDDGIYFWRGLLLLAPSAWSKERFHMAHAFWGRVL
ncbi:MAG: carbamoyltransferase N-terminal domain-containing protein [Gammaproteobacteria bacterium]